MNLPTQITQFQPNTMFVNNVAHALVRAASRLISTPVSTHQEANL